MWNFCHHHVKILTLYYLHVTYTFYAPMVKYCWDSINKIWWQNSLLFLWNIFVTFIFILQFMKFKRKKIPIFLFTLHEWLEFGKNNHKKIIIINTQKQRQQETRNHLIVFVFELKELTDYLWTMDLSSWQLFNLHHKCSDTACMCII